MSDPSPTTAATIATVVAPATVRIGRDGGRGLGVVVAAGTVLTNAHNLRGHNVTVTFGDGRVAVGQTRAVDPDGDLAVVGVETGDAAPVTWSGTRPAIGNPVWAVTLTPTGGTRVTGGAVSSLDRPFRGPGGRRIAASIEHTAPLARGASGGALVDADGALVGLNTHRIGDGFYLALPSDDDLRRRVDRLTEGRSPVRRRLGVALAPPEVGRRLRAAVGLPERAGLLVRGVEDGGPAATAGLRKGDLLVAVGDHPLTGPDDLFAVLAGDDQTLDLLVVRGTDELRVSVDLSPAPADEPTDSAEGAAGDDAV